MLDKLKAKLALRWIEYIDIEVLEQRVSDLSMRNKFSRWFDEACRKMLESYNGGEK